MPLFEAGTTFLFYRTSSMQGTKSKYFIGFSNADEEDDIVVSFVFNTEHMMNKHNLGCNKSKQKFIIAPQTFSFIKEHTSIMLAIPQIYKLSEIINSKNCKILEKANDLQIRQIKNCIDWDYIPVKFQPLIKSITK
jgi:hypothetical protein